MCTHQPPCPAATHPDHDAARVVCSQPAQGWSLLCNGVVVFDDMGELMPDGMALAPRRVVPLQRTPRVAGTRSPVALAG